MPRWLTLRRSILTATAIGLAVRLFVALFLDVGPAWDGALYERAARQLAAGEGYTLRMLDERWPWALPTAFYPPGWPAVLALVKSLGGPSRLDLAFQAVIGATAIPLTARVGEALAGRAAARASAWVVALWPGAILVGASWMGEPLFTVALLCALQPLLADPRHLGARAALGRLFCSGLLFGLAAYVRPTALAIAPLALGGWAVVATAGLEAERVGAEPTSRSRAWTRRALVACLAACVGLAAAALPLGPWMMRNARELDGAVVSSNGGANLYVGTLSSRFERIPDSIDCPDGARELARDRCRRDRALARIAGAPLPWIGRGFVKLAHTFGYEVSAATLLGVGLGWPSPERDPRTWALAAICTLAWVLLFGAALLGVRGGERHVRVLVWAAVGGVAVTHFVFLGGDRYHLPLVPMVAAAASPLLLAAQTRLWPARDRASQRLSDEGARAALDRAQ